MTVLTIAQSLAHIFQPDGGAQTIATITLDDFTSTCAAAIIHIFTLWGLSQLLFGLVYVIVLWRYQALIPLMWLFILVEYSSRLLLTLVKPVEITEKVPGAIGNFIFIPLAVLMFDMSLTPGKIRKE